MKRLLLATALGGALLMPAIATAQVTLPASVQSLGLSDVEVRPKPREHYGRDILGTLPNGTRVEIELDRNDVVEEVEAVGRDGFPASAVEGLIPEAVRANPAYPGTATFHKLEIDTHEIEIEGVQADGRPFEAKFRPNGDLLKLEND